MLSGARAHSTRKVARWGRERVRGAFLTPHARREGTGRPPPTGPVRTSARTDELRYSWLPRHRPRVRDGQARPDDCRHYQRVYR